MDLAQILEQTQTALTEIGTFQHKIGVKMKGITRPVMIAQRPIMEGNHRQAKLKHNL